MRTPEVRLSSPRRARRAIALLALTALAGCTTAQSTPQANLPELPAAFIAADSLQTEPVDSDWWTRFDDPQLAVLVNRAVSDNPSVGMALARVAQAQARARIAGSDRYPQLDLALSASRQQQSLASLGIVLPGTEDETDETFTYDTFQLSAQVSWELDLWGKLSSQTAAARADFLASEANLLAARQLIAAQTARTYFETIEANQQIELAQSTVDAFAESARQIGNRVQVGRAAPNESYLANSNLQSARAELERRNQQRARALRKLDALVRAYPDGEVALAEALPEMPPAPPVGLPSNLLERRPDILAARARLTAAGYRLTAAERSFLPQIALTGSAGTASTDIANIFDPDFFIWSVAGRLLQPVFQGGRLRAQVAAREGERDEAVEAFADVVLTAFSEVEIALALDAYLARQEAALAEAAREAERSVEVAFNRYYVGKEQFLTVIEGQQRAYDARSTLLSVRRARLDNRVALHLALGGGFADDPDQSASGNSIGSR
ncbi:efflux transporter outer membrane subunit [Aurantiacibacter atlanticus]|uniref:efflux transporter outer membrane subunit n=1 Tax=Aurantiacibacter atlanticus TaxID=1648404 RepID=UPI0009ED6D61|nr:efflux transporter outer membrane subunit [Aurantiacibacter atlanticus]